MKQKLMEYYGCKNLNEVMEKIDWTDSVFQGFCTNKDCNHIVESIEPDGYGTCPDCGGKIKSVPMLFGII